MSFGSGSIGVLGPDHAGATRLAARATARLDSPGRAAAGGVEGSGVKGPSRAGPGAGGFAGRARSRTCQAPRAGQRRVTEDDGSQAQPGPVGRVEQQPKSAGPAEPHRVTQRHEVDHLALPRLVSKHAGSLESAGAQGARGRTDHALGVGVQRVARALRLGRPSKGCEEIAPARPGYQGRGCARRQPIGAKGGGDQFVPCRAPQHPAGVQSGGRQLPAKLRLDGVGHRLRSVARPRRGPRPLGASSRPARPGWCGPAPAPGDLPAR